MKTSAKPRISVVTPVYQCDACLKSLIQRTVDTLEGLCDWFEIIMVNDASPDASWTTIQQLTAADERVRAINLSRNFGQHYAISAGIDHAAGDWVVVMDCDLQDPPEMIPRLYQTARAGHYDIVIARAPGGRTEGLVTRLLYRLYYRIYDLLSDYEVNAASPSFLLMSRAVADQYRQLREQRRHFLGLVQFLGFQVGDCQVEYKGRPTGTTSYGVSKKLQHALMGITASTTKLLRAGIYLGVFFSTVSLAFASFIVITKFTVRDYSAGWSSLITSVFFVGGIIMIILGILGGGVPRNDLLRSQEPSGLRDQRENQSVVALWPAMTRNVVARRTLLPCSKSCSPRDRTVLGTCVLIRVQAFGRATSKPWLGSNQEVSGSDPETAYLRGRVRVTSPRRRH